MSVEELYNRKWRMVFEGDEIVIKDDLEFVFIYEKEGSCVIYKSGKNVGEINIGSFGDSDDVVGVYKKVAYLLWWNPPESLM